MQPKIEKKCFVSEVIKVSLLRTGYLKSASNVLTSSHKIWHVNKRDFSDTIHWQ